MQQECLCEVPSKRVFSRKNGRWFHACASFECGFFAWEEDIYLEDFIEPRMRPKCACGLRANVGTVKKESSKNLGRLFFTCGRKNNSFPRPCNFFKLVEEQ